MKIKLMQTHTICITSEEFLGSNPQFKLEYFWLFALFPGFIFTPSKF